MVTPRSKRVDVLSTGKIINNFNNLLLYFRSTLSPTFLNKDTKQDVNVEKVYSLLDPGDESNTSACLKGAWVIIQQTLQLYSLNELLLHILHAVLINYH